MMNPAGSARQAHPRACPLQRSSDSRRVRRLLDHERRVSRVGRFEGKLLDAMAKSAARCVGTSFGRQVLRGTPGSPFKGR